VIARAGTNLTPAAARHLGRILVRLADAVEVARETAQPIEEVPGPPPRRR